MNIYESNAYLCVNMIGRLPVRVELKSLDMMDLRRVLCEKKYNLIQVSYFSCFTLVPYL